MLKRVCAALILILLALATVPASAANEHTLKFTVTDQQGVPVDSASVSIDGPMRQTALTDGSGIVEFYAAPPGEYHVSINRLGFGRVFDKTINVPDTLALKIILEQRYFKTITKVKSQNVSTPAQFSTVGSMFSTGLGDDLNRNPGADLSVSNDGRSETIGLEGHDANDTGVAIDGIPLNAPGAAAALSSFDSSLFVGSTTSFGATGGFAGGQVNLFTIQPTQQWKESAKASIGSRGNSSFAFAEQGEVARFGVAGLVAHHRYNSNLDGDTYLDTSGFNYDHNADQSTNASILALQYEVGKGAKIVARHLTSGSTSVASCAILTVPLPCGYGPGNFLRLGFNADNFQVADQIGLTFVKVALFRNESKTLVDFQHLFHAGQPEPLSSFLRSRNSGFLAELSSQIGKHQVHATAYRMKSARESAATIMGVSSAVLPLEAAVTDAQISDKYTLSRHAGLTTFANILSDAAGTGFTQGFDLDYRLGREVNADASAQWGTSPQFGSSILAPTDPRLLSFDCALHTASGFAPGNGDGLRSGASYRLQLRAHKDGISAGITAYDTIDRSSLLNATIPGSALPNFVDFNYMQQANQAFHQFGGCGGSEVLSASDISFLMPVRVSSRQYRGIRLESSAAIGRSASVAAYYNAQESTFSSHSALFSDPMSTYIQGRQLPHIPPQRAGVSLRLENGATSAIISANYTSNNNFLNIPAYVTLDAGVGLQTTVGSISFVATNWTNVDPGPFQTYGNAVPLETVSGARVPTLTRPLNPRTFGIFYTVAMGPQGSSPTSGPLLTEAATAADATFGEPLARFRLPYDANLPAAPPADPLRIEASRSTCTRQFATIATDALSGLTGVVADLNEKSGRGRLPEHLQITSNSAAIIVYHRLTTSRYALVISPQDKLALGSLFACTQLHIAKPDELQKRKLYEGDPLVLGRTVLFSPEVGLYMPLNAMRAGQHSVRAYRLPRTPPVQPFSIVDDPLQCTDDARTVAATLLQQLQRHFAAANYNAPGWKIEPHQKTGRSWYSLRLRNENSLGAVVACGKVARATQAEVEALGYGAEELPTLNYADGLGLYVVPVSAGGK